jgi:hypothetical protein
METEVNEISINGVVYVPKDSQKEEMNEDNYCIVRTYSAGVFAGNVVKREGQEVVMNNARRIWYWDGAASLSQLATEGTSKPEDCKFPCEVAEVTLLQAIEIIPCTKKAIKSIKEVKIWKM